MKKEFIKSSIARFVCRGVWACGKVMQKVVAYASICLGVFFQKEEDTITDVVTFFCICFYPVL
jgi:hypothetical protein